MNINKPWVFGGPNVQTTHNLVIALKDAELRPLVRHADMFVSLVYPLMPPLEIYVYYVYHMWKLTYHENITKYMYISPTILEISCMQICANINRVVPSSYKLVYHRIIPH